MSAGGPTPYVGITGRLSQVWANRWTILLLLVLVRLLFALANIDDNLDNARRRALSACISLEEVGSSMASMPHYMSRGVNDMTARGIEKVVNGLMSMVGLTVRGVEEIVVFVLSMLYNTYLCLITFVVTGAMKAALSIIEKMNEFLSKSVDEIGNGLSKGLDGFQNGLNDFLDAIKGIPFVGNKIPGEPKVDLSGPIKDLENLSVPNGIDDEIKDLKKKIPDFKDVREFTENLIRLPFKELRKQIDKSMGSYSYDGKSLPVAEKKSIKFCSDDNDINDFFDNLIKVEATARKVFIAVLVVLAILVCIPMAWKEIVAWRRARKQAKIIEEQAQMIGGPGLDGMDAVYIASRPHSSNLGMTISEKLSSSPRVRNIIRWVVAYATTSQALFVLLLAITGLIACLFQFILLKMLEKEAPGIAGKVGNFTEEIKTELEMASNAWANDVNSVIKKENDRINEDLLGWVKTATGSVNKTLNEFVDKTNEVLDKAFGETVLRDPIQDVFDCLIGLKVEGISKGLTWVHDHAQVNFPPVKNDTFTVENLTGDDENILASSESKTTDQLTEAVMYVIDKLKSGLRFEAIVSTVLLCIWIAMALGGALRGFAAVLFGNRSDDRNLEEGTYPNTEAEKGAVMPSEPSMGPPGYFDERQQGYSSGGESSQGASYPPQSPQQQRGTGPTISRVAESSPDSSFQTEHYSLTGEQPHVYPATSYSPTQQDRR